MTYPHVPLRVLLPGTVAAFALALLSAMVWVQLRSARTEQLDRVAEGLRVQAADLQTDLDREVRHEDRAGVADLVASSGTHPLAAGTALVGNDGRVIAATRAEWVGGTGAEVLPPWLAARSAAPPVGVRVERDGASDRLVAAFPVDLDGTGRTRGVLLCALDAERPVAAARAAVWERFRVLAVATIWAALLLGVALNYLVSRRVSVLLGTVERIGAGDLTARAGVGGGDEIGRLATVLDRMAAALAATPADRDRAQRLIEIQNEILWRIAEDDPLDELLDRLCLLVGSLYDGARCAVRRPDAAGTLRVVAGSKAAPDIQAKLDASLARVCGAAALTGEPVFVTDTATDERCEPYRETALELGIRSCWSAPVPDGDGRGTFAVAHPVPYAPTERDREVLDTGARLAYIAIRRAQTRDSLRLGAERLRMAVRAGDVGLWDWDLKTDRVVYSAEWKSQLGYAESDDIGNTSASWSERVHPDDFGAVRADVMACQASPGRPYAAEFRMRHRDGSWRWVHARGEVLSDSTGAAVRMIGTHVDVTERKNAELALFEQEQRLRQMADASDVVFWLISCQPEQILYASPAFETIWGRPVSELYARPQAWMDGIHPDDAPVVSAANAAFVHQRSPQLDVQYRVVRPDGGVRWIHDRGTALRDETGRVYRLTGVTRDITEQKLAADALRESSERFRTTFEQAAVGIAHVAPDGRFLRVNGRFAQMLGYTADEMLALRFHDVTHPERLADDLARADRILSGATSTYQMEKQYLRRDGSHIWAHLTVSLHRSDTGEPEYFIKVVQDITDRKAAEAERERTAALLQAVMDGVPDAIFVKDREGRYLLFNAAAARFVSKPSAEVLGRDDTELFDPDSARAIMQRDRRVMSSGTAEEEEETITAAGVTRTYSARKGPYRDATGAVIGLIGVSTDITERKRVELALRESEERFRLYADHSADALFVQGPLGRVIDVNRQACESLGYTREELIGLLPAAFDADFDVTLSAQVGGRLAAGETVAFDSRHRRKDGTLFPVEVRIRPFRTAAGDFGLASARDISERKRAENALRASEERFRLASEAFQGLLYDVDLVKNTVYRSAGVTGLLGYTPEQIPVEKGAWVGLIHPDDREHTLAAIGQTLADGVRVDVEYRLRHRDGHYVDVWDRGQIVRSPDGTPIRIVGSTLDQSSRKRAERALRESEERFRTFLDNAPALAWVNDETGATHFVNATWARTFGKAADELRGRTIADTLAEHPAADYLASDRKVLATGAPIQVEETGPGAGGGPGRYLVTKFPLGRSPDGHRLIGGVAIEITERVRAEEAVRASERRLALAVAATSDAIWEWNYQTGEVYYSPRWYQMIGADPALPMTLDTWRSLCHPDDVEPVFAQVRAATEHHDGGYEIEFRMARPDGTWVWVLGRGDVVERDAAGRPLLLAGTNTDITERKRAAAFAAHQATLLEQIARGKPLPEVLAGIAALVEEELPGTFASVLLLDREGRRLHLGAAPSLPEAYSAAIDGVLIGPAVGSCGTAAFTRRSVRVDDIATHPLWSAFRDLALAHGLRACWSEPIFSAAARGTPAANVLGTFDVYGRTPGEPGPRYAEVIERAELLASIAIESARTARGQQEVAEQFRPVFESVPVGLLTADAHGRVVMANQRCLEAFGYTRDELLGLSVESLVPPPLRGGHAALREGYSAAPVPWPMGEGRELYAQRKDGSLFPVEIGLVPLAIGGERLILAAVTDITKRVEAERRTRESKARKAAIIHSALDGVISIDHEGRVIDFNPAAERAFGRAAHEVLGRVLWEQLLPPHLHDACRQGMARYLETGEGFVLNRRIEVTAHRADGTEFPVEMSITAITVGATPTFTGHLRDITERKRAEDEIRALNSNLERRVRERTSDLSRLVAILDASPDYISIAADPAAPALYNNAAMLRLGAERGIHPEQLVMPTFHPPATVQMLNEVALPTAARDGIWLGESEVLGPGGAVIPVSQLIQAHKGPDGSVQYFSTIMRDISKPKQLEKELRQGRDLLQLVNDELSKVSRLKDEFLASMSHELRTPLNGVLALSESLQEGIYGPISPQQVVALRDIEQSGRHLLTLINDILDLSKIEAGQITLELVLVEVEGLCQAALQIVKEMAQKKRHRMTTSIGGGIDTIVADPKRIKQVLVNLLSNAVKFTPEGGAVELKVTADPDRQTVSFVISDTGIGIRPEDLGLLFQPFQQIDSRLSREYAGTGLGLALVRRMVELHGGGVEVASEPGKGSRFTVTIPWRVPGPQDSAAAFSHTRVRKVLIVEDSPDAYQQLDRYLGEMNIEATVHTSADGALARARANCPDLILLDLLLPGGSGWDVLTALKSDPELRSIPVVVISILDERPRCLQVGAAEVLLKPVDRETLRTALHRVVVPRAQMRAPFPAAVTAPEPDGPLVLIAEDNPLNARTISDYLRAQNYRVAVVGDGEQAVEAAGSLNPAVILMDIQMPRMDGLEATRRLRATETTATIPIVAVTALAMPGDRERCLAAGANDYLTKPVSPRRLCELIVVLLGRQPN
jgi:PAS domain S-box-containing protein